MQPPTRESLRVDASEAFVHPCCTTSVLHERL